MYVVRGKTYTFVIEGGQDPSQPAAYHPFYITDNPEGGYEFMTAEQKRKVCLIAGGGCSIFMFIVGISATYS